MNKFLRWDDNAESGVNNPKNQFRDETLQIGNPIFVRALIAGKWEAALKSEGFGYANIKDNKIDVSNEIENMYMFKRMMAFVGTDDIDYHLRKSMLADYIKPYYSNKSLNKSLLPTDSFVSDIVDTIASLYTSDVKRYVPDNQSANAFINRIVDDANINNKLLKLHRILRYTNNAAIKIVRRNDLIDIDVYDPTQYRILYNSENELEKVLYEGEVYQGGIRQEVIYVYTKHEFYYVDASGKRYALDSNPDAVNPYGTIPFVICQLRETSVFSGQDYDLTNRVLCHNHYKLMCADDASVSTRHLTFIENIQIPDNAVISNQDVFLSQSRSVDEKASANIISGQMHFQQLSELCTKEYTQAAIERGIPSFFLINNFRELNSAKALKIQMKRLLDEMRTDIPVLRNIEKRMWSIAAIVASVESKAKRYLLPDAIESIVFKNMVIDYGDLLEQYSDTDEMVLYTLRKMMVNDGVLAVSDLVRLYNSDINTSDEALQTMRENLKIRAEFEDGGINTLFDLLNTQPTGATSGQ